MQDLHTRTDQERILYHAADILMQMRGFCPSRFAKKGSRLWRKLPRLRSTYDSSENSWSNLWCSLKKGEMQNMSWKARSGGNDTWPYFASRRCAGQYMCTEDEARWTSFVRMVRQIDIKYRSSWGHMRRTTATQYETKTLFQVKCLL